MAIGFNTANKTSGMTISPDGRTATNSAANGVASGVQGLLALTTRCYIEFTVIANANTNSATSGVGIGPVGIDLTQMAGSVATHSAAALFTTLTGIYFNGSTLRNIGGATPAGTTIGMAWDPATRKVWFRSTFNTNGTTTYWNASDVSGITENPATGQGGYVIAGAETMYAVFQSTVNGMSLLMNSGESPYVMIPPDMSPAGSKVWYVDPEGGQDTGTGLSFIQRKRVIGGPTGIPSSLAGGDVIRVMASRPKSLVGNATWTDNSGTVTLDASLSGLTQVVDNCEVAWLRTGGAASISTASTVIVNSREGNNAISIDIPASGTGKLAYKTLGAALDLSAFTGVSMSAWYTGSTATPAPGVLVLDLCSDATGDVPLKTIPLNYGNSASLTLPTTNGSTILIGDTQVALPSGVNSVALRLTAAYGTTQTIIVDNIIATKSWSDPNHISHMSLISKDNAAEPEYYPIMSISGTTVVIGGIAERVRGASVPQPRPYRGTTETVPTYFRTPTRYNWTTAQSAIVTGGTVGNRVVVSGGWSRTDMSTQTDITVFSAVGAYSQVFSVGPGISSVEVSSFAYAHFNNGNLFQTSFLASGDFKHHVSFVAGCWNTPFIRTDTSPANGQLYDLRISRGWTFNSGALVLDNANIWKVNGMQTPLKAYFRRLHGRSEGSAITLPNGSRELINMRIDMIDNNSAFALTDSTTYYLQNCYLRNCVMQNNAQGDFAPGLVQLNLFLERCTFQGPVISGNPNTGLGSPFNNGGWAGKILVNAFGGVTWDNREYSMWYRWVSDNANRHIPAGPPSQGASWKVSLYNSTLFTADFPARKSLVKVACKANEARTVSVWLMRDDPGLTLGLMTLSSYVAGVTRQQVPMTAGASTWQQVSISFTPTEDGLVDIWGYAFGGTTFNGWFSDVSVT